MDTTKKKTNRFLFPLFFALFMISYASNIRAQEAIAESDSTAQVEKRLKFGLGFGLNFVGGTNIGLAPNLTYSLSERFTLGAGLQVNYTAIKDLQRTTTYGANLIAQYFPAKRFVTLLEFTQLRVNTTTEDAAGDISTDFWDSALFVGAGLGITNKITVGAKLNLLYDEDETVYTSPVIPFVNITF